METGIADDAHLLYRARASQRDGRGMAAGGASRRSACTLAGPSSRPGLHKTRAPRGFQATDPDDRHYNWATLDQAVDLLIAAATQADARDHRIWPAVGQRHPARRQPRYKPDPEKLCGLRARRGGALRRRRRPLHLIWNEPNQAGLAATAVPLLARITAAARRRTSTAALRACGGPGSAASTRPRDARRARWRRGASGHERRNVPMRPLVFLRALGCVDRQLQADPRGRLRLTPAPCAPSASPTTHIGDLRPSDQLTQARRRLDGRPAPARARTRPHRATRGSRTDLRSPFRPLPDGVRLPDPPAGP